MEDACWRGAGGKQGHRIGDDITVGLIGEGNLLCSRRKMKAAELIPLAAVLPLVDGLRVCAVGMFDGVLGIAGAVRMRGPGRVNVIIAIGRHLDPPGCGIGADAGGMGLIMVSLISDRVGGDRPGAGGSKSAAAVIDRHSQ